jgi:hypothetical protein
LSGINELTNAKQRLARRDGKQVGNPRVRGGDVNFFVGPSGRRALSLKPLTESRF